MHARAQDVSRHPPSPSAEMAQSRRRELDVGEEKEVISDAREGNWNAWRKWKTAIQMNKKTKRGGGGGGGGRGEGKEGRSEGRIEKRRS